MWYSIKLTNHNAKMIQYELHKSYHSSKIKIIDYYLVGLIYIIFEAVFHAENTSDAKELISRILVDRNSHGVYSPSSKTSYVFKFNIKEDDIIIKELTSVWILLHELRHHFQNTINKKLLKEAEKDAEKFAYKMFDKNYEHYKILLNESN